jgi:indole-3-glycerol phosphate synthase
MFVDEVPERRGFKDAITRGRGPVRAIAEVKRRSPSAGDISPGASVTDLVQAYELGGASAVSVLTSADFAGSLADLNEARTATSLPLLRKDFISCEYQVLEARVFGASAVLLISDALDAARLEALIRFAGDLGMDALVESHRSDSLARALEAGAGVIGINNRDLRTLEVDLAATELLAPLVPGGVATVSESGIRTREDVSRVRASGADALLLGEELMRSARPADRLRELLREDVATTASVAGARPRRFSCRRSGARGCR